MWQHSRALTLVLALLLIVLMPLLYTCYELRQSSVLFRRIHEEKLSHRRSEGRIPPILHQSWKSSTNIPAKFAPYVRSWRHQHPAWTHLFWDDADNIALIKIRFPQFYEMARALPGLALADFTRYAIMFEIGGVYADLDFESLKPLDALISDPRYASGVVVSSEPLAHTVLLNGRREGDGNGRLTLCNAILLSRPGHVFWLKLMETIHATFISTMERDPVSLTGPRMVQHVWRTHFLNDTTVAVLPEEYFYPEIAYWNRPKMDAACASRNDSLAREACAGLVANPKGRFTNETLAVHHWECTWWRHEEGPETLDLARIVAQVKRGL